MTPHHSQYPAGAPAGPDGDQATRVQHRLLDHGATLSVAGDNRLAQEMAAAEGWGLWPPGGVRFADGSVLWPHRSSWQALSAQEAGTRLRAQLRHPLEVRLLHVFVGHDGREKRSVAEARFIFHNGPDRWQLVVEYEGFMDSPLFAFGAESFADLGRLDLLGLRVDTPRPGLRWRLEHIALHPDWLELLCVSRGPEEAALDNA